jgi:hypothetical protein
MPTDPKDAWLLKPPTRKVDGGMAFAVGRRDGHVVLRFQRPVDWIVLSDAEAREMARHLLAHASSIVIPN